MCPMSNRVTNLGIVMAIIKPQGARALIVEATDCESDRLQWWLLRLVRRPDPPDHHVGANQPGS